MKVRNTFIIFIVSGFWHGANWTFIVWGALNAIYFLPLLLLKKNRVYTNTVAEGKLLPSIKEFALMSMTFLLTLLAWVFFRAESVGSAVDYIGNIFNRSLFTYPEVMNGRFVIILLAFIMIEWLQRERQHALQLDGIRLSRAIRWIFYYLIIFGILAFGAEQQDFIYFQF